MADNPYQHNSPISDPGQFAGRQEAFNFIQLNLVGVKQKNALVLLGGPQIGKSSLLRQLPDHLDPHYVPIRLSLRASTVAGEKAWLTALAQTIPQALAAVEVQSARLPELPGHPADLREALEGDFMKVGLHSLRRGRHLLVLIDGAERLLNAVQSRGLPRDTFKFLAQLLDAHDHFDVIMAFDARYEPDLSALGAPFDPTMFYRVGLLPQHEMTQLLTQIHITQDDAEEDERLETDREAALPALNFSDAALEEIYELTAGHPYLTQLMGWLLYEHSARRGHSTPIAVDDVGQVIEPTLAMGGDTLGSVWRNGSEAEQMVLTALSALSPTEPPEPIPFDDIGAWLMAVDRPMDPRTINATWRRLEYEGVLLLMADGKLVVCGGLQRRWLRSHVSMPREVRETPTISWRWVVVAAGVVLAVLLALLLITSLQGAEVTNDGSIEATITMGVDLQETSDTYFATQTALP